MANAYLTSNLISKEAAAIFKNLNSFIATGYKKYENMYRDNTYKSGDTINVRLDNYFVGSRGDTVVAEDITEQSIPVTIGALYSVPFTYRPTDLQREIADFGQEILMPACRRIISMINEDIFLKSLTQVNHWVGAAGAYINSFKALDVVNPRLDTLCANGYGRYASISPINAHELRSSLQNNFNETLNKEISFDSKLGRLASMDILKDNSITKHTAGTAAGSAPQVRVAISSGSTVPLKGAAASATFKAGDIISFANVFGVNRITRKPQDWQMQFVITADATADGAGDVDLQVYPSFVASGQRQNFFISGGSEIPIDTAVAILGTHTPNIAYTERGLITCMPPLERMDSPDSYVFNDKDSGISLRVSKTAEVLENKNVMRLDAQAAISWVPDQAVRIVSL